MPSQTVNSMDIMYVLIPNIHHGLRRTVQLIVACVVSNFNVIIYCPFIKRLTHRVFQVCHKQSDSNSSFSYSTMINVASNCKVFNARQINIVIPIFSYFFNS